MSKRRARTAPVTRGAQDVIPVSARIPWSYLACLLAAVVAGLLVVLGDVGLAPILCRAASDDALGDCKFGWVLWFALIGFLVSLVPIALALRLGWQLVLAVIGLAGLLLSLDAIEQVWWWVLVALAPAAAALLSADWERGRGVRVVQWAVIAVIDVAAVIAVAVWFSGA